jgi:hypothetical protein
MDSILPLVQVIKSIPNWETDSRDREVLAKTARRLLKELAAISDKARQLPDLE